MEVKAPQSLAGLEISPLISTPSLRFLHVKLKDGGLLSFLFLSYYLSFFYFSTFIFLYFLYFFSYFGFIKEE